MILTFQRRLLIKLADAIIPHSLFEVNKLILDLAIATNSIILLTPDTPTKVCVCLFFHPIFLHEALRLHPYILQGEDPAIQNAGPYVCLREATRVNWYLSG